MPPAFVLSQDQTLKFIPDPSRPKTRRGIQSRATKRPHQCANLRQPPSITPVRPPSAHPFPLLHNLKQHPPQPSDHKGAALIGPPATRVNTRLATPTAVRGDLDRRTATIARSTIGGPCPE